MTLTSHVPPTVKDHFGSTEETAYRVAGYRVDTYIEWFVIGRFSVVLGSSIVGYRVGLDIWHISCGKNVYPIEGFYFRSVVLTSV